MMANFKPRIMIIDDNPRIHRDVIKVLSPENSEYLQEFEALDAAVFGQNDKKTKPMHSLPRFTFDTATQGQEGVEKISQSVEKGEPYALAFVDVRMPPGWDGIETIKQIWEIDPQIQIIICTAYSDYDWEETVEQLGISDNYIILKKPFDQVAVKQLALAMTQKWQRTKRSKQQMEKLYKSVTAKKDKLHHTLSILRSTLEASKEGILIVDLKRKVIDFNQSFIDIFEISQPMDEVDEQILQQSIANKIISSEDYLTNIEKAHLTNWETSQQIVHLKSGRIVAVTSQPYDHKGVTSGRVFNFMDITDQAFMEKKLEHQATHDDLTDLPNRMLLRDRIAQTIESSTRNKDKFAVIFFDLDRFRLINDSLGPELGDKLLCEVSERISSLIRKTDTLSRLGGDEFVILLSELQKDKDVLKLVDKIIQSLNKPFEICDNSIVLTCSMGISLFPLNGLSVSSLLKNADLAMNQAKVKGGNRYQYYTEQLNQQSRIKLELEGSLREALKKNEFFLLYQPQLHLNDERFLAVEALIRWQHPQKGVLSPFSFIPVAEENGLIIPIGEWVIKEACRQIVSWQKDGYPNIRVAVNVANLQLKQSNFDKVIKTIMQDYQVTPTSLEIEITENVFIHHRETISMINKLRNLGLKIILDDFGTGNTSLNYLKKIQVDRLKIDRSFIKNISMSENDEAIIMAIIALSKKMGFKILAEGVEDKRQIEFLKENECDEVQGFYYSKPLKPAAIIDFVKSHSSKQKK